MAQFKKAGSRLPPPPSPDQAPQNLKAPETAPLAPETAPEESPRAQRKKKAEKVKRPGRPLYLTDVPESVHRQIRMQIANDPDLTARVIVLRALKNAGFDIDEAELTNRRRE
jgi:hypothetical protein